MADSTLRPSGENTRALAEAVNEKVTELRLKWRKHRGVDLGIPPAMALDFKQVSQMIRRHRNGDVRNTEAEAKSLDAVAQWSLQVLREFTGKDHTRVWRQDELV